MSKTPTSPVDVGVCMCGGLILSGAEFTLVKWCTQVSGSLLCTAPFMYDRFLNIFGLFIFLITSSVSEC